MSRKRVVYYVDARGVSPVLDEIRQLAPQEQRKILAYVTLLGERGEELRRPMADYIGDKLYELRPKAHRVLYFFLLKDYDETRSGSDPRRGTEGVPERPAVPERV